MPSTTSSVARALTELYESYVACTVFDEKEREKLYRCLLGAQSHFLSNSRSSLINHLIHTIKAEKLGVIIESDLTLTIAKLSDSPGRGLVLESNASLEYLTKMLWKEAVDSKFIGAIDFDNVFRNRLMKKRGVYLFNEPLHFYAIRQLSYEAAFYAVRQLSYEASVYNDFISSDDYRVNCGLRDLVRIFLCIGKPKDIDRQKSWEQIRNMLAYSVVKCSPVFDPEYDDSMPVLNTIAMCGDKEFFLRILPSVHFTKMLSTKDYSGLLPLDYLLLDEATRRIEAKKICVGKINCDNWLKTVEQAFEDNFEIGGLTIHEVLEVCTKSKIQVPAKYYEYKSAPIAANLVLTPIHQIAKCEQDKSCGYKPSSTNEQGDPTHQEVPKGSVEHSETRMNSDLPPSDTRNKQDEITEEKEPIGYYSPLSENRLPKNYDKVKVGTALTLGILSFNAGAFMLINIDNIGSSDLAVNIGVTPLVYAGSSICMICIGLSLVCIGIVYMNKDISPPCNIINGSAADPHSSVSGTELLI